MKVEELSRYGKTLSGLPREAVRKQRAIVLQEVWAKFGLLGLLPFLLKVVVERGRLRRTYPAAYQESLKLSRQAASEFLMLAAMYNTLAREEGGERAYAFLKKIFQRVAVHSMPALYQIDDLVACEGDPFDNFVEFNVAFFGAMNEEGTFKVSEVRREPDKLTIVVSECANCEVGRAYDCFEIARLGCDHDLAGYPVILDRVDAEFRRPHTLAKGDDYCDFMFFRKGTAPDTEHLNK